MGIRSQKMAQEAYPLVDELRKHELESKYRTLALTFPTMILQSGLSQAVGFLVAKSKGDDCKDKKVNEHKMLLCHLETLLLNKDEKDNQEKDLHQIILNSTLPEYQLLTRQALDAASTLKRYTQALLEKE